MTKKDLLPGQKRAIILSNYDQERFVTRPKTSNTLSQHPCTVLAHDGVIKWDHFPRYWPYVRGIHRWPVNSPHKDQWRRTLMFSLICAWPNGWVNNRDAGDLRRYRLHYDVNVMGRQIVSRYGCARVPSLAFGSGGNYHRQVCPQYLRPRQS